MSHKFTGEAGAALVFLIGYLAIFGWMLYAYLTHRIKWRSRYSLLFFHVTIRVVSQACGVAFGVLGFANTNLFIAFTILSAEGYFSLMLCAFRFVVSWQEHNLPGGISWLEPPSPPHTNKLLKALVFIFLGPLAFIIYHDNPMVFVHSGLIIANAAIVAGGAYLAGADNTDLTSPDTAKRIRISKIARSAGQGVFLALNAILLLVILVTMRNNRRDGDARKKRGTVHPTLWILFIAWFPLIVRGIFGTLQAAVWSLSYYNPDNYSPDGFTAKFTAIEYILGVLTEWLACALFNLTYLTSRHDPKKRDGSESKDAEEKSESH